MKQLAVIFEGDIRRRLGVFNAVISRVKHLQDVAGDEFGINVQMIQVYDGRVMSQLRHTRYIDKRPAVVDADGVSVRMLWVKRSWRDAFAHRLFHRRPKRLLRTLDNIAWNLRGNSLVSAHDRIAGHVAAAAGKHLQVPCFITWHGASIYTDPPRDPMLREMTIELLRGVDGNFFVSQGLLDKARETLTDDINNPQVLLNGADSRFKPLDADKRTAARREMGVDDDAKMVAFVGRFEPVKNVTLLPEIFKRIAEGYHGKLQFWAIGDGVQLAQTKALMQKEGIDCHFTGLVPPETMPQTMACIDLLLLPSKLEGLPLVAIEALQSGAHVVATNVIGTAEAVGKENAIDLGDNFVQRFAARAIQHLNGNVTQTLPADVSWTATARKEYNLYHKELGVRN